MEKSIISRIYTAARHPTVLPEARQALFGELKELSNLKMALKLKPQKTKMARARKIRVLKPSSQTCKLCKTPFPHDNKLDWRNHMLKVRSHKEWAAAKRYWTRVGYNVLGRASGRARLRISFDRRLAIFKEEAPRAAAILGDDAIIKLADARRYGVHRYLEGLERWRLFVRRHYSRSGER